MFIFSLTPEITAKITKNDYISISERIIFS